MTAISLGMLDVPTICYLAPRKRGPLVKDCTYLCTYLNPRIFCYSSMYRFLKSSELNSCTKFQLLQTHPPPHQHIAT